MDFMISTRLVTAALEYYGRLGYKPIDVPLCVSETASAMTRPCGSPDIYHNSELVYVASAEQSFIQLHMDCKLPNGNYMALTPCLRSEDDLDQLHQLCFMKLELIEVGTVTGNTYLHAKDFFEHFAGIGKLNTINICGDSNQRDLELDGVELGSYGLRRMPDGTYYYYGTGLAEPRFSTALNMHKHH